ncbi:protein no-on-transient A-like [Salvia splendens]|uniref:protein no-on-transient A-like n=1 Tax=Salvia splendens TaxID=180675 RepID=UPI001C27E2AA|nr:protein no-on-transient A-like [Salvia splendens]
MPRPPPAGGASHQTGAKQDKSKLWCSHCGKNKHTRESCFLRVGYPEWWDERQRARAQAKLAAANIAATEQRQNAQITQRGGAMSDGNKRDNTLPLEISAGGSGSHNGGGGGGGIRVENFVERTGAGEASNWGGGGYNGGYSDEEDRWAWH